MDVKEALLKEQSKSQSLKIAGHIGNDPGKFSELMDLFLNGSYRITQRSAMVVNLCASKYPGLIIPYLEPVLLNLKNNVPEAVIRNTLRILQFVELPNALDGLAADICFSFLESSKTPVAIRVFAMTILFNICKKEPDLANELKILIEDQLPYSSAGFKSRGNKILREMEQERYKS
ncbi:MAG TPA: hypothetical protein VD908_16135 [Cytophagales bacterium]|nr:hypothetical protein [Cytophagales bacterium]